MKPFKLPTPAELKTNLRTYVVSWLIVNDHDLRKSCQVFFLPYFLEGISREDSEALLRMLEESLLNAGYEASFNASNPGFNINPCLLVSIPE